MKEGAPRWFGFFAAVSAGVALALLGVLYAVDGVALKQAVNAWASTASGALTPLNAASGPAAEQAARFASAEAIRWLEWGTNMYQGMMQGLALVLLGAAIAWSARVPRPIGFLVGLSGLGFMC